MNDSTAVTNPRPDVTVTTTTAPESAVTPPPCQWAKYVGSDPVPQTCERPASWSVLYACGHFNVSKKYCDTHLLMEQRDYEQEGIRGMNCGCEMTFVMVPL